MARFAQNDAQSSLLPNHHLDQRPTLGNTAAAAGREVDNACICVERIEQLDCCADRLRRVLHRCVLLLLFRPGCCSSAQPSLQCSTARVKGQSRAIGPG